MIKKNNKKTKKIVKSKPIIKEENTSEKEVVVVEEKIIESKVSANYYDKDYFENGLQTNKSGYAGCIWEERYKNDALSIKNYFNPKKVLDLGCSKGFRVRSFLELGVYSIGCDISEYAINNCDPVVSNFVYCMDVSDKSKMIKFRTGAFDIILCFDILEHLNKTQLDSTLDEIKRMLKPEGILITQMPMEHFDWDNDKSHIGIRNAEEWKVICSNYGLKFFNPNTTMQYWTWTDPRRGLWFKKV